jgi:hypothetical protein
MSMWSDYQKELNPKTEVYEDDEGFIQYTHVIEGKPRIFVDHLFLKKDPKIRKGLSGDTMKRYWVIIYDKARELGCEIIATSICTVSMVDPEKRLYLHFRSGWKISHLGGSVVYLYKDLPK